MFRRWDPWPLIEPRLSLQCRPGPGLCALTISSINRGRLPRMVTWPPHPGPAALPPLLSSWRSVLARGPDPVHGSSPRGRRQLLRFCQNSGLQGGVEKSMEGAVISVPSLYPYPLSREVSPGFSALPISSELQNAAASQGALGGPQFHNVGPSNIRRGRYKTYAVAYGYRYCRPRTTPPTSDKVSSGPGASGRAWWRGVAL